MPTGRTVVLKPTEAAAYTRDMLVSLRNLALGNNLPVLAQLLHLAAVEAKYQADQETPLPG